MTRTTQSVSLERLAERWLASGLDPEILQDYLGAIEQRAHRQMWLGAVLAATLLVYALSSYFQGNYVFMGLFVVFCAVWGRIGAEERHERNAARAAMALFKGR